MKHFLKLICFWLFLHLVACSNRDANMDYDPSSHITLKPLDFLKKVSTAKFADLVGDLMAIKITLKDTLILPGMNKIIPIGINFLFCDKRLSFV